MSLWDKAISLIPTGTQTLSKTPSRYVDGVYPKFLVAGHGCIVSDDFGAQYIDYICGLGPILLGYNHKVINHYVKTAIEYGQVILSLPHPKEVELAEALNKEISCAEKIRFFKTGTDTVTSAVKVARAYTGKDKVLICGYHGWADWYTIANEKKAGIPKVLESLVQKFKYNDPQGLEDLLKNNDIAAVVMEPVVYEEPKNHFLSQVINLAHNNNALVVFDEVITGFRFGLGGAGGYFGVSPDLACFSKAMGNGFPVAALVGKSEYMNVFEREDFFISGTFGGDLIGISAALGVIDILRWHDGHVIKSIWENGKVFKDGFNSIAQALDLDIKCSGYAPRTMFDFPTPEHKALFWQECVKKGILFGYANFINYAHNLVKINQTLQICEDALKIVKSNWKEPESKLEGNQPVEVFRLR